MGYELDPEDPKGWRYNEDRDSDHHTFREMTDEDIVTDDQIATMVSRTYGPLEPDGHPASHLLLPGDHEREQWDAGRTDPRPT